MNFEKIKQKATLYAEKVAKMPEEKQRKIYDKLALKIINLEYKHNKLNHKALKVLNVADKIEMFDLSDVVVDNDAGTFVSVFGSAILGTGIGSVVGSTLTNSNFESIVWSGFCGFGITIGLWMLYLVYYMLNNCEILPDISIFPLLSKPVGLIAKMIEHKSEKTFNKLNEKKVLLEEIANCEETSIPNKVVKIEALLEPLN